MKKYFYFLSLFFSLSGFCQQAVSASGGNAVASSGSVSYTIGQIDFESASSSNGKISQGVQQPFEVFVVLSNNTFSYTFAGTLAPNPAQETTVLSIGDDFTSFNNMNFDLTDITGKVLRKGTINSKQTNIDVATLAEACYFLNIYDNGKQIKTFKLLKHL